MKDEALIQAFSLTTLVDYLQVVSCSATADRQGAKGLLYWWGSHLVPYMLKSYQKCPTGVPMGVDFFLFYFYEVCCSFLTVLDGCGRIS